MKDLLYKKFNAVPTRPGRGGTYSYLKWQDVADRMNQIFGINWSSEIVYQDVINSNVVTRLRVTVFDRVTGIKFYQEGFGGAPMDDRQEAGNPFKSAYSKALKDACKKWGVGLYLEEDDEPEAIQSITSLPDKSIGGFVPVDTTPFEDVPAVPVPDGPIQPVPVVPIQAAPPVFEPEKEAPKFEKAPSVKVQKNVPNANVIPPVPTATIPMKQVVPETAPNPVIPPVSNTPAVPNAGVPVSGGFTGGQSVISDVQRAALQSIISIQGVEYDQLVKDAFESRGVELSNGVPIIDDLSYKEAVMVVKYGNDKFRNR